jgi:hypothetical protein
MRVPIFPVGERIDVAGSPSTRVHCRHRIAVHKQRQPVLFEHKPVWFK